MHIARRPRDLRMVERAKVVEISVFEAVRRGVTSTVYRQSNGQFFAEADLLADWRNSQDGKI